ncbi:helix-turn-helix domain-containing protein [Enterococcus gilvus]|uniref:helix-turn-helix transcriptional regulator n=1 Tax=Enterococcus gilvus TaxID=160453 RepID=UPI003ED8DD12
MMDKILEVSVENTLIKKTTNRIGWQVYMLMKGNCQVCIEMSSKEVHRNQFFILNYEEELSIKAEEECTFLIISLDKANLKRLINRNSISYFINFPNQSIISAKNNDFLTILNSIMNEYVLGKMSYSRQLELSLKLYNFLETNFKEEKYIKHKENSISRIDSIKQYIEENYQNDLSLAEIALHESFSYSYLSKYFKENMGITFKKYLTQTRLKHAVNDLISTNTPIVEVGMNNGFWNPKTFSKSFKELYNFSPSEYRKRYKRENIFETKLPKLKSKTLDSEEIINLLTQQTISTEKYDYSRFKSKKVSFDTQNKSVEKRRKKLIINIGIAENMLKHEYREQIENIQDEIGFDYVRLIGLGVNDNIVSKHNSHIIPTFKDTLLIFQYFREFNLVPIIQVKSGHLNNTFFEVLQLLVESFSKEDISKWRIEIDVADFYRFRRENSELINQLINNKHWKLGLYFDFDAQHDYKKLISWLKGIDTKYYFISVNYFLKDGCLELNSKKRIHQLMKHFSKETELFLHDWNTVSGKDIVTVGTFFRAALMIDVLQEKKLSSLSFWLNLEAQYSIQKEEDIYETCLSLYVYSLIKRPVYFLLNIMKKIKGNRMYFDKNYSLYQERNGELNLLLSNPIVIDPDLSINETIINRYSLLIDCELINLPIKNYEISTYFLDKDNGGTYNQWMRMGGKLSLSSEYLGDLYKNIHLRYEKKIKKTECGIIKLNFLLTFNSVLLVNIRPI